MLFRTMRMFNLIFMAMAALSWAAYAETAENSYLMLEAAFPPSGLLSELKTKPSNWRILKMKTAFHTIAVRRPFDKGVADKGCFKEQSMHLKQEASLLKMAGFFI